jgi:ribosome-associated translation inhibitor RaiA
MKFVITHRHHDPSPAFTELTEKRIESLREALQIDEARVLVERRLEASPAFRISAHLVTPGPDILAEAVDHTLRAALEKLIIELENRIDHRHEKRARGARSHFKIGHQAPLTNPGTRS